MTRRTTLRSLAALVLALAVAACERVDARVVPLGPPRHPRRLTATVRVLRPPLGRIRAREVALMELTSYGPGDTLEDLLPSLREHARAAGANAVVVMRVDRNAGFLRVIASALLVED